MEGSTDRGVQDLVRIAKDEMLNLADKKKSLLATLAATQEALEDLEDSQPSEWLVHGQDPDGYTNISWDRRS